MPISKYDYAYGGKKGSATKAYNAMVARYGAKKGKQVFYAKVNDEKKKGLSRRVKR